LQAVEGTPLKERGKSIETFIAGAEMVRIRLKKNHVHQGRS
jgi:hypothetical protein